MLSKNQSKYGTKYSLRFLEYSRIAEFDDTLTVLAQKSDELAELN